MEAIALYAENLLAWKEWMLFGPEADEMVDFLEHARSLDPMHPAVARADARRAQVLEDAPRCRELARSVHKQRSDPLAVLIEGECTIEQDPATAESLIFKVSDGLPRAVRIGARAQARKGGYATALKALDQLLAKDPKNGRALIEAAMIDHAVGNHDRELLRARGATRSDGDQLRAQLMLGKAQAEIGKQSSAKSTFTSLATNETAPPTYRREAWLELARLALREGAADEALDRIASSSALGADPAARVKAEALLLAARPAEVLMLLGQPRAIEAQVPELVLIGGAHVLNGRPDEAKHAFETAVSVRPQDPRLFTLVASARALLDDFGGARAALDKVTWLDPLEVLEDAHAPDLSHQTAKALVERLAKMRDASGDPPCVDASIALLSFYAGDREEALRAARRSSDSPKPVNIAMILEGHLVLESDPARAEELADRIGAGSPSVGSHLFVARLDRAKKRESAADAYAKALSINPELPLAKIERTALELRRKKKETIEELLALHVAYGHIGALRRVLFQVTQ